MSARALRDTFRVKVSTDPSVNAVRPVVNGNQEALAEAQERLLRLEEKVEDIERLVGCVPPRPDPRISP